MRPLLFARDVLLIAAGMAAEAFRRYPVCVSVLAAVVATGCAALTVAWEVL